LRVSQSSCRSHRRPPRPEGSGLQSAPHIGQVPRRAPSLRAVRTSSQTARHQPRCPLVSGQAHRRDKALMAARTSSKPASLQPRSASRAFLPSCQELHPKAGSSRAGREPAEDPHAPKDAGSSKAQSLDRTHATRAVTFGSEHWVGRSKLQPTARTSPCNLLRARRLVSGHCHVRRAHDPTPTQVWHF
jgi:hypothetical protein